MSQAEENVRVLMTRLRAARDIDLMRVALLTAYLGQRHGQPFVLCVELRRSLGEAWMYPVPFSTFYATLQSPEGKLAFAEPTPQGQVRVVAIVGRDDEDTGKVAWCDMPWAYLEPADATGLSTAVFAPDELAIPSGQAS